MCIEFSAQSLISLAFNIVDEQTAVKVSLTAVIMTEVIARVHSVHPVNVEQRQAATDPQTKPPDLGCESACFMQMSSATTIAIYYYYSVPKLMLIYRPIELT